MEMALRPAELERKMTSMLLTSSSVSLAQEIQVLKTDLQRTMARLNDAHQATGRSRRSDSVCERHTTRSSRAMSEVTASPATTMSMRTPTTIRSYGTMDSTPSYERQRVTESYVMQELVETARRRRLAEMQLARELQREAEEMRYYMDYNSTKSGNTDVMLREIAMLQHHRKSVMQQIDEESKEYDSNQSEEFQTRHAASQESSGSGQNHSGSSRQEGSTRGLQGERGSFEESQKYSIEGVVKLVPVQPGGSISQPPQHYAPDGPHQARMAPQFYPPSYPSHQIPYGYEPRASETLQDVFSIQLKFAETMMRLEKSIQVRDRLLQPSPTSSDITPLPTPDPPQRRRRNPSQARRRRGPPRPSPVLEERLENILLSDELDDSSTASPGSVSEELLRRYRLRRRQLVPPPLPTRRPADLPTHTSSVNGSTTTTAPSTQPSPEAAEEPNAGKEEDHKAKEGSENVMMTPLNQSTRLKIEEASSSGKQVRFNASEREEYLTPLIARNISFDQESLDSSDASFASQSPNVMRAKRLQKRMAANMYDDEERLSFMDDSSVTSSDLNDESFLAAFHALRRELRHDQGLRTPVKFVTPASPCPLPPVMEEEHPALSILFAEEEEEKEELSGEYEEPEAGNAEPEDSEREEDEEVAAMDPEALKKLQQTLALDIQELTARLVLTTDAPQRQLLSQQLQSLRDQMQQLAYA
ncbi:hypothetical protein Poli38472_001443 [Pythium oligandrum]|uniref:Uncharacterized protein n=1 Tax=Pythium oligandrum TaxID=41045 RepID=A0A8K1FRS0_PYTOL|nr:hypothetical protein Poli38472_001443 [Pythium oligandrum]|eukprot:TMW69287.1 hypothetical protein Poli38472_001443 [Pythium oligandrum]